MAALLALLTFAVFIGIDYMLERRRAALQAPAVVPETGAPPMAFDIGEPNWVAGYELPEPLHYHRGHTWVRRLSADTVAVGIDDFARRLLGKARAVATPDLGNVVEQGEGVFRVAMDGRTAELVAPVSGQVVEVNPELGQHPDVCCNDPYRTGWLVKLRSTELPRGLRNLLSGKLARRWMEDAREQLELNLMALSRSVLQDGGEPAPDFSEHLDDEDWERLCETFLLTEPIVESDEHAVSEAV